MEENGSKVEEASTSASVASVKVGSEWLHMVCITLLYTDLATTQYQDTVVDERDPLRMTTAS